MSVPLEVFCCYAREDQEMLEHLKKHLMPLQRSGQITVWSDTNLNAGVVWEKELHQHLESADIILLLISPDFMASDYCYSSEMGRAIERHNESSACVIPVLLRSTFWDNAPFATLQMVPTNAKYVTSWPDRDEAFHDITRHVNRVISELQKESRLNAVQPLGNTLSSLAIASEEKSWAVLSYLLPLLVQICYFLYHMKRPKNRFAYFHILQSSFMLILPCITLISIPFVLIGSNLPMLGGENPVTEAIAFFLYAGSLLVYILSSIIFIFAAIFGKSPKFPLIGKLAEGLARRFTTQP
jgi:uncharacterized membrane protein